MLKWVAALFLGSSLASALEVEGFLTSDCKQHTGLIVNVTETAVDYIGIDGHFHSLDPQEIETLYVFNVIENPFEVFHVDVNTLSRLKALYLEDSKSPQTVAFPVRFIDDLLIFYSIDGKSHVHTFADLYKLRPAEKSFMGDQHPKSFKKTNFEFTDQSSKCSVSPTQKIPGIKPTRVLADKISISEYLNSFSQGYQALESFQERTYLYSRPFLFDKKTRLGLIFQGQKEEPKLNLPLYFQWSTGQPYRFQSFNVMGMKSQEFTPNTEPVFVLRSDVKSHAFHALFVGNVAGMPAGRKVFLSGDYYKPTGDLTVQPGFNYLAMMGGDYGPYSLSLGFFYPTYGIKVRNEFREVLGTSTSYAIRAMYTTAHFRLRAVGALTDYSSGSPSMDDVIVHDEDPNIPDTHPDSYSFDARFIRGGIDYEYSSRLKVGLDGILMNGNYKETLATQASDIKFNKFTVQGYVTQSFSDYVSVTAYVNLNQNNYKSNFNNISMNDEERNTVFFGTFEFIF